MRIYCVGHQRRTEPGGGFTFVNNLIDNWAEFVLDPNDCDIYFIPSASLFTKQDKIPEGKKVVLRVDNALKNSRNNNSGMRKMKDLAQRSDLIIYQSKWAKEYLSPFLDSKAKEVIIVNGGDTKYYHKGVSDMPTDDKKIYLYSRSSNNESKMWEIARYEFQKIHQKENAQLWIVGRFSPENLKYNFDFYADEDYKPLGFQLDKNYMAMLYQSADYLIFPHFNEACPNTLIEWLLVKGTYKDIIFGATGMTGGSIDIIEGFKKHGYGWLKKERMISEYREVLNEFI